MAIIWHIKISEEIIAKIKGITNIDNEIAEHLIDYVQQSPWMLDEEGILDYCVWVNEVEKEKITDSARSSLFHLRKSSLKLLSQ